MTRALARRALVVTFGVAERIHDPHRADLGARLEERGIDQHRSVHAARDRRRLRLRGRVHDGDVEGARIGVAELVAQHLREHVVRIAAQQRADRLALQVADVADRRILARRQHEAEMPLADGDELDGLILGDQPVDRGVAPHSEVEVAGDECLDHGQCRRIVAVIDGEVVARVGGETLERLVGDHVLRDRRIAGGPRLTADGHLRGLAALSPDDGGRCQADRRGRRHEAAARRAMRIVTIAHGLLLVWNGYATVAR